ncbi:MAG: hypothetical protein EF811_03495 [Methanonatronarchaeia archaeon]|nr:MAG: hypothetical protein EF811_03495 [Methanonatronarchaeia archaeon]
MNSLSVEDKIEICFVSGVVLGFIGFLISLLSVYYEGYSLVVGLVVFIFSVMLVLKSHLFRIESRMEDDIDG